MAQALSGRREFLDENDGGPGVLADARERAREQ
jgi:hypothetical protein